MSITAPGLFAPGLFRGQLFKPKLFGNGGTASSGPGLIVYLWANAAVYSLAANAAVYNLEASTMTAPGQLQFLQGEDVNVTWTMSPIVNITGWTIVFYVGGVANSIRLQIACTVSNGPAGIFTALIPDADTATLDSGLYAFEVRRTDSGYNTVLSNGAINLVAAVAP
jgi:hypothetical protein